MVTRLFTCRFLAILALAFTFGTTTARAGLTTYPDIASWSGAVSGVTNVAIPDPAPLPDIFFGSGDASVTYGGVTFSTSAALSNGNFFNVGLLSSGEPAVLSSQEYTEGVANILITLPGPVTALALNFGTFDGSDVKFLLSNGDSVSLGSTSSGYSVPDFFGVTDTTAFTSVLLTSTDFVLNMNNLSFGTAAVVPEPSSLTLFCGLLAGAGTVFRTRRPRQRVLSSLA
jgi:hypothetical protein